MIFVNPLYSITLQEFTFTPIPNETLQSTALLYTVDITRQLQPKP